jgi:hypothetical protein
MGRVDHAVQSRLIEGSESSVSDPNDWQSQDEQNANDALRHTIYTERPGWPIYEAKLVRSVPAKWVAVVVGVAVAFLAAMVIGVVISDSGDDGTPVVHSPVYYNDVTTTSVATTTTPP